jgi:outer membrane protein OmpA-like peptidoglycan-associated protein
MARTLSCVGVVALGVAAMSLLVGAGPDPTPGATSAATARCVKDADCGAGLRCVRGECEEPFECEDDAGCPQGMQCVNGTCEDRYHCASNADCFGGQVCRDHLCVTPQAPAAPAAQAPAAEGAGPAATVGPTCDVAALTALRVPFATADAVIRKDAAARLTQASACVKGLLAGGRVARVRLEGHTDERGADDENDALGRRRAEHVRRWLESRHPELRGRLEVTSHGEARPLCRERAEACWSQNRRVELVAVE